MRTRLHEAWGQISPPNNESELFLGTSLDPYLPVQRLLKEPGHVVFLLAPERIHYSQEIFSGDSLCSSLAQIFFDGINVGRETQRDFITYAGINAVFLPGEFSSLSRTENLTEKSNLSLNSTGIQRSFQILKPIIARYLKLEQKSVSIEAPKSKVQPKSKHKK